MVVISYKTLREFIEIHPQAEDALNTGISSHRRRTGQFSPGEKKYLIQSDAWEMACMYLILRAIIPAYCEDNFQGKTVFISSLAPTASMTS